MHELFLLGIWVIFIYFTFCSLQHDGTDGSSLSGSPTPTECNLTPPTGQVSGTFGPYRQETSLASDWLQPPGMALGIILCMLTVGRSRSNSLCVSFGQLNLIGCCTGLIKYTSGNQICSENVGQKQVIFPFFKSGKS